MSAERCVPKPGLFVLFGFLLVALSTPFRALADIYSFTDENGTIHFSNVPTEPNWKMIMKEKPEPPPIKYESLISKISKKYLVDNALVKAIIRAESDFDPEAVSKAGAKGLMQLMPQTAREMEVKNLFNPEENIEGGVRYFKYLMGVFEGNLPFAVAAYHAGETTVKKYNGIPPFDSTQIYVKRVLKYFEHYKK